MNIFILDECVEEWKDTKDELKHYSRHNNKKDCEAHKGVWTLFHNYLEMLDFDKAQCEDKNATSAQYQGKLIWGHALLQKVLYSIVSYTLFKLGDY